MDSLVGFVPFVIMFLCLGTMWVTIERSRIRQREFWATLPPSRKPL